MGDRNESDGLALFGWALMAAVIVLAALLSKAQADRKMLWDRLQQCEARDD